MAKIVKHNEFKKIMDALWSRLTEVFAYFEKDKASLNKDNVFVGKNTFNELLITGKTVFTTTGLSPDPTPYVLDRYCGYRANSTHRHSPASNKQYVSAIKIRVSNTLDVGDTVGGIHIVEVEKRATKQGDIVGNKITDGGSFVVEADNQFDKCIYVPVEKEYDKDTYFLIAQVGTKQLVQTSFAGLPNYDLDSINALYIDQLPAEGQPLGNVNGVGWVVIHGLATDTINVRKKLNSLGIADITGLQGQLDGKIDKTQIGTTDGKIPQIGAGDKLPTSIMPDIAITSVQYASNDVDMMAKTVQVGDIVVAAHEDNSTYMCKDAGASSKNDRFIKINMGFPVIKKLNEKTPDQTGALTIGKTDIHGYKGKKILVYGDTFAGQTEWQNIVGNKLGVTFYQMATPNATLCNLNTNIDPLCGVTKTEALIRELTNKNIDVLLIMAGANDLPYDGKGAMATHKTMSLHYANDEYDTVSVVGSMNTIIKEVSLQKPDIKIFVCTFPNVLHQGNNTSDYIFEYKNGLNITHAQVNSAIKESAILNSIPCIDVCGLSGISKLNRSQNLTNYNTLNTVGNKAVANVVINELLRFNINT